MVSLPADVKPIYGNPNLDTDVRLQKERGEIASPDQRDAERITAIAGGVKDAFDGYYDIREKQSQIAYRETATDMNRTQHERNQLQLEQDLALQDATIAAEKQKLAQQAANARLAANMNDISAEAYSLANSPVESDKLKLVTSPKFKTWKAGKQEFMRDFIDELQTSGSQATQDTLKTEHFDKLAAQQRMEAGRAAMAGVNKEKQELNAKYSQSPSVSHIDLDRYANARIIQTPNGPDLEFLDDKSKFSDTLIKAERDDPTARRSAVGSAISIFRAQSGLINKERTAAAQVNGQDPAKVVTVEMERAQIAKQQELKRVADVQKQQVQNLERMSQDENLSGPMRQEALAKRNRKVIEARAASPAIEATVNTIKKALARDVEPARIKKELGARGYSPEQIEQILAKAQQE